MLLALLYVARRLQIEVCLGDLLWRNPSRVVATFTSSLLPHVSAELRDDEAIAVGNMQGPIDYMAGPRAVVAAMRQILVTKLTNTTFAPRNSLGISARLHSLSM